MVIREENITFSWLREKNFHSRHLTIGSASSTLPVQRRTLCRILTAPLLTLRTLRKLQGRWRHKMRLHHQTRPLLRRRRRISPQSRLIMRTRHILLPRSDIRSKPRLQIIPCCNLSPKMEKSMILFLHLCKGPNRV